MYLNKENRSHGTGSFKRSDFDFLGKNVVLEPHILVFHPENIRIGDNVYIGHYAILKGYYKNKMIIGSGSWIGQQSYFHSAGGIVIGNNVGVGPGVKIITSLHIDERIEEPIMHGPVKFAPVKIGDGCDIGVSAVILPGVSIGQGVQVGAGAVVNTDLPSYTVAAGVPAKVIRKRA